MISLCISILMLLTFLDFLLLTSSVSSITSSSSLLLNSLTGQQCQVNTISNFPELSFHRYDSNRRIIRNLWNERKDVNYFRCFWFDYLEQKSSENSPSLHEAVIRYSINNTIILMFTDKGYSNSLLSTYYASKLYNYSNLIVVCADIDCYTTLYQKNIHVVYVDLYSNKDMVNSQYSDFGSNDFNIKQHWKMNLIMACLHLKVKVMYMDSDIFLLQNPLSFFEQYQDLDFVAQEDAGFVCAGFIYFWPTATSLRLLDVARHIRAYLNADDQTAINTILQYITDVQYEFLPSDLFMSGGSFFEIYQHSWDLDDTPIYMWHNNFVVGKTQKEYRAKEMGFYFDEDDADYASKTMRYFTIHLLHSTKVDTTKTDDHIKEILMKAVNIANSLERSFVVPPSTCKENEMSFCNLCYYDEKWCFGSIISKFTYPMKESTFFADSRVPIKYRLAFNNSVVYDFSPSCHDRTVISQYPPYKDLVKKVECVSCVGGDIEKCIIEFFSNNQNDVIEVMSVI